MIVDVLILFLLGIRGLIILEVEDCGSYFSSQY
jgi:hypothetical protein